ncbi:MAG: type II secretion system protein [Phycisphaerae bacterium]|nr:type II secretion system protein [Phycisphaerae bacterium]
MQSKKTKAFTLIELLVVISIIALLVSILMPALSKARKRARAMVCVSNNRSLMQALSIYFADNENKFLPYYDAGSGTNLWMNTMLKSSGDIDEVRFCPEAPTTKPSMAPMATGVQIKFHGDGLVLPANSGAAMQSMAGFMGLMTLTQPQPLSKNTISPHLLQSKMVRKFLFLLIVYGLMPGRLQMTIQLP